ncbi:MAG: gliding motility-associated-like protein [Vicingaceae bacterium]|jgi:gliding motility-associated-like protein
MKKLLLKIPLFFLFLFLGNSLFATHIMGGEITWECLNNGQYVFTLKVYRDCNGIGYNVNNIALEAHNYPNAGNITLIPVSFFSVTDITPSCEGSPCATLRRSDPDIQGAIEEYVLKSAPTTLNGVPPATGWAFTWTSGNRNVAIDNINNASNFGITLRAIMFPYFGRNANLCFDSSPDFYQKPSTIICAGERFTYNHSAFDSDLDSLAYEWARPLEGNLCGTSPCQIGGVFLQGVNPPEIPFDATRGFRFDDPYPDTLLNPLNEAAVLDSETGEITFTSYTEGEYVSVIKVTAYKCGAKVAEIYRELQTVIASGCASNEPPLISPLANNSFRDTVKVGDTVRFRISILDSIRADNPNVDSIFVFGSGQQFGANFTDPNAGCLNPPCAILTSPLQDTGIGRYTTDFYWETTCDHIQNTTPICFATANSYQFIIRAFDDFCPAAGQTIATYTITILADSLVANPAINCANVSINGDVIINWDGIHDPDKTFSAYLIYVADFRNGPYTLLDSIFDSTLTSYTHIGAGANNNSKHYIVKVRSGCQAGWTILPTDTISTIYIDPILNDTCVSFSWTGLDVPLPNNSDTNYLIFREYPIGSGFVLYDSMNILSYCDTFPLCTDTVTYRILLGNNGGDCPGGSSSNTQGVRFKYPDPNFSLTAEPSVTCNGLSDANAVATAILGSAPFTYLWNTGSLTDTVKNIPAGKYFVTITDIKGCTSIDSIIITEPDVLAASIGASTNVSCNGGADGTASVTVTGGTTPYSYSWPSGDTTANDTGLTQGTYVVTVTDFNNCTSTSTVIITEPDLLTSTISAFTAVSCNGGVNGTATVTASGGTNPYTYAWPSGTLAATETGLSQGTYVVTVTDSNNCISTSSIIITEPSVLTSAIGTSTNVSCNGGADGTASVTVTGGTTPYSYSWPSGDTTANDTGLTQGTYVVTVTDFNNCTSIDTVIITEPDLLTSTISAFTAVSCNGGANGTATVTASGGTTPYTYAWPSGTPTANETGLSQGTYVVTVTDFNNCTSTSSIIITEPNVLTSAIGTSTNVSCNGGADGTATVTAAGGTTPYSYSWPSGDTMATDTGLTQGTYLVTVTDFNNCTSTDTIIITEPSLLTSTISSFNGISCNGSSDGTATVNASGGTAPYSYAWPSGTPTATETGLDQGTYIVTVTDFNNCTSTSSVIIVEPTIFTSAIGTSTNVSCNGGVDGTAAVTASGGTTPYSYSWPSGDTTANDSGLTAGTYVVTITDFNNCTSTDTIIITEPDILTSTISAFTAVSCNGGANGAATVTASGGTAPYSYAWPSGTPTATETVLSQGTYMVTVTDFKNCTSTSSVIITEPNVLTSAIATSTNVSCNGGADGTATVTASGGTTPYSYSWPSGDTTATDTTLTQGTYVVTVTDFNNCTSTDTIIITEPSLLTSTISSFNGISCNGSSDGTATVTASGGTAPYSYAWPSGTPTATETGLDQGTYVVTVTDFKNCTSTSSINITEPNVLTSAIGTSTNVSCNGGADGIATVTASGGTTPYSYSWSSGDTTATDSGLTQGTYIVTVTDFNNCTSTDTITITEPNILTATISASTNVSCNGGSNGAATVTASGGTVPYTYAWPSGTPTANEAGLSQGTYVVTVTDFNNCTSTATVLITQPDSLTIAAANNPVSCFGLADGQLSVTPIGGTSPYTFNWSNNVTDSINSGLVIGNYQVTITDSNGCSIDSSFTIVQPDIISLLVSPYDTICIGNSTTIQAIARGGNSSFTYTWNNNLSNSSTHRVSPTTQTTYTVSVTDDKGCSTSQGSIIVTIRDLSKDNLQAFSSGNICIGDTTNLTATHDGTLGGYGYTWSNNVGNGLGPIPVSPATTTQYIVNAFDVCGSIISDSIDVIVENYPLVNLPSIIKEGCEPLTVNFRDTINSVPNNLTYTWDLGDGSTSNSNNFNYTYDADGTYSITLKISTPVGCESNSTNQSQVIVYPTPEANFSINPNETDLNNSTVTFTNTSVNTNNVEWDFYNSFTSVKNDTVIQFNDTGWFPIKLVAYSRFGCKDSAFKNLRVNPVYELIIPNAFTPNTGGSNGGFYDKNNLNNDVFYIHTDLILSYEMQIFNRWGELIFLSKDVNRGWDGYYLGRLSPQDVYVYKVSVVFINGKRETKTGNFTLFR